MAENWWQQAPERLPEYHEGTKRSLAVLRGSSETKPHPLDALFSPDHEPTMKKIWERIANLVQRDPWDYEQACFQFYDACGKSLTLYSLTPAERRAGLLEIATKARELSDLISTSEVAWTSVLYYVRDQWSGIDTPEGTPFPRIEELLIDLADDAESTAARSHKFQTVKRINKAPDGTIPPETFRLSFVRKMVPKMRSIFGSPCHAIVADAATVIIGIDTDENMVWQASRNSPLR